MNEETYLAWAKAEWARTSIQECLSKMEKTLDDMYELTDFLEEKMLFDSDSADMVEAIPKYESFLKIKKEDVTET